MKTNMHSMHIFLICISAFNLGYLHRYLLPVAQDGWGISWIHVEISFCRPKKNSKIYKLNANRYVCYRVHRIHLCRQFSWQTSLNFLNVFPFQNSWSINHSLIANLNASSVGYHVRDTYSCLIAQTIHLSC